MDPIQQGKIALVLVKALARRGGAEGLKERLQQLEEISSVIDVSMEDLKTFAELMVHEIVKDYFAKEIVAK